MSGTLQHFFVTTIRANGHDFKYPFHVKDLLDEEKRNSILREYKTNPAAPFFLAELKKARFSPRVMGYDQVLDAVLRGRDKMLQGETVEAVLPVMNDEMNAVLNRERARAAALVK